MLWFAICFQSQNPFDMSVGQVIGKLHFVMWAPSIWFQFLIREKWRNTANLVGCSLQVNLVLSRCTFFHRRKALGITRSPLRNETEKLWLAFYPSLSFLNRESSQNKGFRLKYCSILLLQHEYIYVHWKSNMRQKGKMLWTLMLMN